MPIRGRQKLAAVFVAVAAALVAARSLVTRLYDPDLWWILAHGREMFRSRHLLSTEIFSHTLAGVPIINFEWLAEVTFFGAWQAAGPAGILAIKVGAGIAIGCLLAALARRHGARGAWLALLAWVGFWALRPRLNERAELATLIAIPAALLVVERALADARWRTPSLVLLFLGMIPPANAHGGWIFVPALIFLRCAGAAWSREDKERVRYLAVAALVTGVAGLVNPYGPRVILLQLMHVARLGGGLSNRDLIEEWKPTTVSDAPYFWALYVLVIIALGVGFRRKEKWVFAWSPALLAFGLWGAYSYRNAALFVFPALPFLAASGPTLFSNIPPSRRASAGGVVLAVLVALKVPVLAKPWPDPLVQWNRYPVKACDYVRASGIDGRMLNGLGQGGYIGWALGPERKIFCDGRYIFFPLVRDLVEASLAGRFDNFIEERGVDYAVLDHHIADSLLPPGRGLDLRALLPEDKWALVFWDDAAMVFVKRLPKFKAVIDGGEYLALTPYNPTRLKDLTPSGVDRARIELERHRKDVGFSVFAREMEASLPAAR